MQHRREMQNIRKSLTARFHHLLKARLASRKTKLHCKQASVSERGRDTATFQRDLLQHLTKSPGEEFPSYSQNFPRCIL